MLTTLIHPSLPGNFDSPFPLLVWALPSLPALLFPLSWLVAQLVPNKIVSETSALVSAGKNIRVYLRVCIWILCRAGDQLRSSIAPSPRPPLPPRPTLLPPRGCHRVSNTHLFNIFLNSAQLLASSIPYVMLFDKKIEADIDKQRFLSTV